MREATLHPGRVGGSQAAAVAGGAQFGKYALLVGMLLAVWGIVEHDPVFANAQQTEFEESEVRDLFIDQIEQGNAKRKVALLGFGLFGIWALVNSTHKPWNPRWVVLAPVAILIAGCFVSVLWSGQPAITSRRLVVLGCIVLGCAGLARLLRPTEFLTVTLLTLAGFVVGAVLIDIAAGGRPWDGSYRFGGTLHPNAQANYCGMLALAATCQPIGFGKRWVLRLIIVIALLLIVLTQSRTGLMSSLVALAAAWTVRLPAQLKWAGVLGLITLLATMTVAYSSIDAGTRHAVGEAALMGRREQAGSLTGRLPLWEELLKRVAESPVVGYGYEGFWTEDRIAGILKTQNWTLQNAHNSYLEITLALGVIGLFFGLWMLIAGTRTLAQASALTRDPGYAFLVGVMILGMANSCLESLFLRVRYCPSVALTGLLMVGMFYPTAADPNPESPPQSA